MQWLTSDESVYYYPNISRSETPFTTCRLNDSSAALLSFDEWQLRSGKDRNSHVAVTPDIQTILAVVKRAAMSDE